MTTYSLAAYELAVRFVRTKKTIMVEGASDKRVIMRMMLERGTAAGREFSCLVDDSAMVSDAQLSGKGSKEKVELIASAIGAGNAERFNWIVDREWEGIDTDKPEDFHPPVDSPWGLRTKGHSIENYWLRLDALRKYLHLFFGDVLSVSFFTALEARFDKILQLAAAYSFSAKQCNIITRCGEAISRQDVEWTGAEYVMLSSFSTSMATRGVAVDMAAEVNSHLQRESLRAASRDALQWICHGHLGEEMIRACAANLAIEHGCPALEAKQIERGKRSDKLLSDSEFVAQLDDGAVHPLGNLLAWAE